MLLLNDEKIRHVFDLLEQGRINKESINIIFEQISNTGIIKLNRPEALNALNFEMSENFSNQLNEWIKNDNIKQVLFN